MVLVEPIVVGNAARVSLSRTGIVNESLACLVEAVEPVVGTNPQRLGAILVNTEDVVAPQAAGIVGVMPVLRENILVRVEPVKPPVKCTDPQNTGAILIDRHHGVVAQTARIVGVVLVSP
jgi:hypothetical protein